MRNCSKLVLPQKLINQSINHYCSSGNVTHRATEETDRNMQRVNTE